jgi:hypothetical protein
VDLPPLEINSTTPQWLRIAWDSVSHDNGILSLLAPTGITISTSTGARARAELDAPSSVVSMLADCVASQGQRLTVAIPPIGRHLPLLMAVTATMANAIFKKALVESGATFQQMRQASASVLIVSPDLDLRSRYSDLYVGSTQLDEVFHGSRMKPNGTRVALRSYPNGSASGVCFFLPTLTLPSHLSLSPRLVIVDARYGRWTNRAEMLARWVGQFGQSVGVVVLYSLGDDDTSSPFLKRNFIDFPFDHVAVESSLQAHVGGLTENESVDWSFSQVPNFLKRSHEVTLVPTDSETKILLKGISRLLDEHRDRDNLDLRRARWLLAILSQMPVPLIWYEEAARDRGRSAISSLIKRLGMQSESDEDLGPVIQSLKVSLEQLYDRLRDGGTRALSTRDAITGILSDSESASLLVLVRDDIMELALRRWLLIDALKDKDYTERLEICSCPHFVRISGRSYNAVVVQGCMPRRYRWILGARLGDVVRFLAYDHEVQIIEKQLLRFYGRDSANTRARQRDRAIASLSGKSVHASEYEEMLPSLAFRKPDESATSHVAHHQVTVSTFSDLASAFAEKQRYVEEEERLYKEAILTESVWTFALGEDMEEQDMTMMNASVADGLGIAIQVKFAGALVSILRFPAEQIVDCMRPSRDGEVARMAAEDVLPGDVLLVTRGSNRASLFDRIIDLAQEQPRLKYLATFRRTWQQALTKMAAEYRSPAGVDYVRILRALQNCGATIESGATVRGWVRGDVIGPETPSSIAAVGHVSLTSTLVTDAKAFDRAFRQIRGLHQSIGRRLSSSIRRTISQSYDAESSDDKDPITDHLQIPIDELLDTIELAHVLQVTDERRLTHAVKLEL